MGIRKDVRGGGGGRRTYVAVPRGAGAAVFLLGHPNVIFCFFVVFSGDLTFV